MIQVDTNWGMYQDKPKYRAMNKIKHLISAILIVCAISMPATASASPLTQFGAKCTNHPILTFPSWYKNLDCQGTQPEITKLNDIWIIALNIVETLIGAAAYVAVGFIIWGGFKYMKSRGDPGKITEAKTAITQAVIGLGIALASTAIVIFVGSLF